MLRRILLLFSLYGWSFGGLLDFLGIGAGAPVLPNVVGGDSPRVQCGFFIPVWQICCGGRVYFRAFGARSACCGGLQHDFIHTNCCNGRIAARPGGLLNSACCGYLGYHNNHQMCCSGLVFGKGVNLVCCGRGVYNPLTQACCFNKPVPKALVGITPECAFLWSDY